jgi:DNA helicase HerA-like ATPase
LQELARELEALVDFMRANESSPLLQSSSGGDLFEPDDKALLNFLRPKSGGGPTAIQSFRNYHDPQASDVATDIIQQLDNGMTVILDLGSATDKIRRYFSDMLSKAVFARQEEKFAANNLGEHFVQLYFEEAHNLFPRDAKDLTDVYSRFAKEGAKFNVGMVYSTQSPSTISQELLAQTENFFVGHLSSQDEARSLARVQVQFDGLQEEIMRSKTPGYMRMLTQSHRFVIPVQVRRFEATAGGQL